MNELRLNGKRITLVQQNAHKTQPHCTYRDNNGATQCHSNNRQKIFKNYCSGEQELQTKREHVHLKKSKKSIALEKRVVFRISINTFPKRQIDNLLSTSHLKNIIKANNVQDFERLLHYYQVHQTTGAAVGSLLNNHVPKQQYHKETVKDTHFTALKINQIYNNLLHCHIEVLRQHAMESINNKPQIVQNVQLSPISPTANGVDRKALRETLYSGIFHRHRRTIFALGSFLRMLRSRNSDYNAIKGEPDNE